jgi:diacylglycerol kinase
MKQRCQAIGTTVLRAVEAQNFVLQPLTVLLSYPIVASVPLLNTAVEWKMQIVQRELNRTEGATKCQALTHPGWGKQ